MTEASPDERDWLLAVGMRFRLARVRGRESQRVLAARAGLSSVTLGSIERGDHVATLLTYTRLARALGLPLDRLLGDAP